MRLTGQQLGHYRIAAKLGEGGMGVVYRAHDTRLGRDVAIKVLPDAVARDPERLARFEREARTLAALNHPNIAAVYGVEQGALVMELVEGETLKGPLPLDTAINYARQIADALEAAHERGIIHRDLKPANIKITPEGKVKLLDFGLAKAMELAPGPIPESSPTLTAHASMSGIIVGTPAYMSPEQARGTRVDHRTDIWAFGVVLYEMLTGKRLFDGPTVSDVMAAVLTKDPPLDAAPAQLRPLLARCLERDPHKRLGWIGEACRYLDATPEPQAASLPRWVIPTIVSSALLAIAATWLLRPSAANSPVPLRAFSFTHPSLDANPFVRHAVISPNGRYIVYGAEDKLWLRELASEQARALEGSDKGTGPFWSPDSSQIAFVAGSELKKVFASGGSASKITGISMAFYRGGAWSLDGQTIIVSRANNGGLAEVPAAGGNLKQVLASVRGGTLYSPAFLPGVGGGRLIIAGKGSINTQVIELIDLKAGTSRTLRSGAFPAWSSTGHILFQSAPRTGGVWALPFSTSDLAITGEAFQVLEHGGDLSASGDHTLIWSDILGRFKRLAWVDRSGKRELLSGSPQDGIRSLSISPDGTRAAYAAFEAGFFEIWIADLVRSVRSRFSFGPGGSSIPQWAPTGRELTFSSGLVGGGDIVVQSVDGSADPKPAVSSEWYEYPSGWSPDGRILLFGRTQPMTGFDLWTVKRKPDGSFDEPAVWLQTSFDESDAALSPDGRFVVYTSDESGRTEVYVRTFPAGSGKRPISAGTGHDPRWGRDGKEIFYLNAGSLYAVDVTPELVSIGSPHKLFQIAESDYDISPDGKRFLFAVDEGEDAAKPRAIHVIENWPALLRQKASVTK